MRISWRNWLLVGVLAILGVGVALAPVWLGSRWAGPDEVLTTLGRDDEYVYLTWVRQAARGQWLFDNPYTLEPHNRLYFNPLFLLMGKLAGIFSLAPSTIFNLFRVGSGVVLVVGVFLFLTLLIQDRHWRLVALLMTIFTGGLSYLSYSRPPVIRDFNDLFMTSRASTEARFLPSILFYPQGPASVILLLATWSLFFQLRRRFSWVWAWLSLVCGSLLVAIHPYDVILALLMPVGFLISNLPLRRKDLLALVVLGLSLAPVSFFFWLVVRSDPVYLAWTQVKQRSPPFLQWLVLYAPILPLTLIGLLAYLKGTRPAWLDHKARLIIVWLIVLPILVYLPLNFQRRLAEGAYLPITFMAVVGCWWLGRYHRIPGLVIALFLVILSLPDYPYQAYLRVRVLREDIWGGYYLPRAKLTAYLWVDHYLEETEAVLALPPDGLYLPAVTGNRVYLGHWANTVNSSYKWDRLVEAFLPGSSSLARDRLLAADRIRYLLVSKTLPSPIAGLIVPWQDVWLRSVFENDQVAIFRSIEPR